MSTEHESRVEVKMTVYVDIETDSHPEDIDEDTMKDILSAHVTDELKSLNSLAVDMAIDEWDFENVKMFVDGVEQE